MAVKAGFSLEVRSLPAALSLNLLVCVLGCIYIISVREANATHVEVADCTAFTAWAGVLYMCSHWVQPLDMSFSLGLRSLCKLASCHVQ